MGTSWLRGRDATTGPLFFFAPVPEREMIRIPRLIQGNSKIESRFNQVEIKALTRKNV
jgi:hypothetical protein